MRWYPFFALCLLMTTAHGQAVFECKQKDGSTAYQDTPCPGKPNDPPAMTFAKPTAATITPQQRSQAMALIEHLLQIGQLGLAGEIAQHNGLESYLQQRMSAIAQQDAAHLRQGPGSIPPPTRLGASPTASAVPAPTLVSPRIVSTPTQSPAPGNVLTPGTAAPSPIRIGAQRPASASPPATPVNAAQANPPASASQGQQVECLDKTRLTNKMSPMELWASIASCVSSERYDDGVFIYALAGAYGAFDHQRVADASAHQVSQLLPMLAFASMPDKKVTAFEARKSQLLEDESRRAVYCKDIARLGPPDYYPTYMVQHGLGVVNGADASRALVVPFDAKAAWAKAVAQYLECPTGAKAIGAALNLFSGFKVEREVLIDPDHINHPLALLRAADGGYFILQSDYGDGVVKVDSSGQPEWVYRDPDPDVYVPHHKSTVQFRAAVPAPDGGVLLGGHRGKLGDHGRDEIGGVLILLDKHGREVSRIDPARDDTNHKDELADFYVLSRWGDGYAAFGGTNHGRILIRLRADGTILWKKKLELRGAVPPWGGEARPMPNGDLVVLADDTVARLNGSGATLMEVDLPSPCHWITSTVPDNRIRFFCQPYDGHSGSAIQLVELDDAHKSTRVVELSHLEKQVGSIGLTRTYAMEKGGFVLMAGASGQFFRFVPTIMEVDANQKVIAKKEFLGIHEDVIIGGMPTGVPGEWVVVRPEPKQCACTAMTFLRRY